MKRAIVIIADNDYENLRDAMLGSPYADEVTVLSGFRGLKRILENSLSLSSLGTDFYFGWQGEWWTRPDLSDILALLDNRSSYFQNRNFQWLPDNWFCPILVANHKDGEAALEWLESMIA